MTNQTNHPEDFQDAELDGALRKMAREIHPRPAFVAKLRGELEQQAAHPRRDFWSLLDRARPWLAQAVLIGALAALVLIAGSLTGRLFAPDGGDPRETGAQSTPGVAAGDPSASLPAGALARLGKGKIQSIDTASDGRIAVGSTASLCIYNDGLTADWCRWTDAPVHEVQFDPTGTRLAVRYGTKPEVEIWDAAQGQVIASREFSTPTSYTSPNLPNPNFFIIKGVAWEPEGSRLAVIETGQGVSAWDWQNDAIAWGPVAVGGESIGVEWITGPEGESIVAALTPESLTLVDGSTGQVMSTLSDLAGAARGTFLTLARATQGSRIAVGSDDKISVFDLAAWNVNLYQSIPHPAGRFYGIALSTEGEHIAALTNDAQIITFDLRNGQETGRTRSMPLSPMAWEPEYGRLYYASMFGSLGSFSGNDNIVETFSDHTLPPQFAAWRDDKTLITVADNIIYTWDVSTQSVAVFAEMTLSDDVTAAGLSKDGTRALFFDASASDVVNAARIIVWDVTQQQPLQDIEVGGYVLAVTLSPDGTRLAAVHGSGQIFTWKLLDNGAEQIDLTGITNFTGVDALAFHPDGDQIAIAYTNSVIGFTLEVWSITDQALVARLAPGGKDAFSLPITSLDWSADGTFLGVTQGQTVEMFEMNIMQPVPWVAQPDQNGVSPLGALQFHPFERETVAAAENRVHVLSTSEQVSYNGHAMGVTHLAFRPDGEVLASASIDGTVILWNLGAASLPPVEVRPTETPQQAPEPVITESTVIEHTPTPYPTPTQDITPPPGSPTPLPNATQRPIPDTTGYDVTQTSGVSMYGTWTWMFIRGEWTTNAPREEDLNFILVDSIDGPENWVLEEYTPHGLGEGKPTGFTFSADDRYLYFYDAGTPDGCGLPWRANLRRMNLETGIVEPVKPFSQSPLKKFIFSPDSYRISMVTGTDIEIHNTLRPEPGGTSLLYQVPIPFQPPVEWSIPEINWQPSGTSTLLAFEIVSPPENPCDTPSPEQQRWTVVVDSTKGTAWSYSTPAGYTLARWKEGEHWSQQLDPPPDGELIYRSLDGSEITVNPRTGHVVPGE